MQDTSLAPGQGAANAKVGFEAWLSGLFEEDHTVSDADQTQDSKARRLSLGGTSTQIMRGNKIANGKLLRRRRELPAARQKQVVVANPYLDSESTITTSRTDATEDKASEDLDKIRMRWDSQRKLSISTVRTDSCTLSTTANFSNYGYGSQYFPLSAKRSSRSCAPVTKAEAFTRLEPGSMLWPLIADSVGALCARSKSPCKSSSLWARTTLLPCVVVNLDVASKDGIPVDAAFDYCYSIQGSGDGLEAAYFERGAANENLIAAVDNIFPATSPDGFPIAVAKRAHFRTREADLTVDRHYGHHASLVFLYSREHIHSEIERNAPGTLSIQAFQKARGARPWIVRALWDQKRKCRSVWILTSTSEYVQQPHEEATKVGQLWTKATSGQQTKSASRSSSGQPMDTRVVAGSLHVMHGRNLRSHHVHELATDMSSRDRCNIVQASPAVWPVPAKMIDELAEALRRISRLPLAELAADFCQDEQSGWHLLQVKAFKLEEEGIMSTEEAKRRSHGTLVPIVRPLVRPKRKRIVTRDQDSQATVKNTLRKCAGDLCGGKVAVSRSSKPVAKREIFLERASQRAWDEARALGTATHKPVYDTDELFAWLAEDEQKNQNQLVRVCETCYEGYRALAAIREEGKSHGTGQRSSSVTLVGKHGGGHAVQTGEKAQKACLRLYEQFEEQARKKTLGVAKAMLEVQARELKQANERRRLRRKRRPKRQSSSIQNASSSRQLSREGIHDSIGAGVNHVHEVSDARWETDSEWSGISLCPGDRVRDTDLREGTVVEVHEADDTCTVQFDTEKIEARVSVSVLSHADIPQDTEFLQLSAADLIGVGPLPPLKKKSQRRPRRLRHSRTKTNTRSRVALDATGAVKKGVYLSSNQDEDGEDEEDLYHAGVDEENDDEDNDDDDNDEKSEPEDADDADEIDPVTGVSKSFRDLFVTSDQVPASDTDLEKSHTPLYYRHQPELEASNARLYDQGVHHMY